MRCQTRPRAASLSLLSLLFSALFLCKNADAYANNGGTICSYSVAQMTASRHGSGSGSSGALSASLTSSTTGTYSITMSGFSSYEGIVLWVRDSATSKHVGSFTVPSGGFQTKTDCSNSQSSSTIQHSSRSSKSTMTFTWTPDVTAASSSGLVVEAVICQTLTSWFTIPSYTFKYAGPAMNSSTGTGSTPTGTSSGGSSSGSGSGSGSGGTSSGGGTTTNNGDGTSSGGAADAISWFLSSDLFLYVTWLVVGVFALVGVAADYSLGEQERGHVRAVLEHRSPQGGVGLEVLRNRRRV